MTSAATRDSPAPARARRSWGARRLLDLALALLAHAAVGLAWLGTAASVMGSLGVLRRIPMNSEFAWDTGRLPQPWAIPLCLVGCWGAHRFFRWAMARVGGGRAAWGPSVVAWCGALLGVLWGAYNWIPPVQVGVKVGPASGQSEPWGVLGWAAYYSSLAIPAVVGLVTAALLVLSRNSPLVVATKHLLGRRRRPARAA